MKAIETIYGGYRFRSRLEARWAVFFDTAETRYQYEPEGLLVPWRLTPDWQQSNKRFGYLPDFWLTDLGLWGEVKGGWTAGQQVKALNAAAYLSDSRADVLLLADTFRQPRKGSTRPWRLTMTAGALTAAPWPPLPGDPVERIASESDGLSVDAVDLLRGYTSEAATPDWYRAAARSAQQARFEFGQTPGRGTL